MGEAETGAAAAAAARAAVDRCDAHVAALEALVRIPSVSAAGFDPAAVRRSAEATADLLSRSGLEHVRLVSPPGGHPNVIGEWCHAGPSAPTVLLYAHHDVQPPGLLDRWSTDPFTPVVRDGRLYGRGSADDKAGAVAHAAAVSAWLDSAGALPCNVKVLVEGEEEIGSPHLEQFLTGHAEELGADVLVLADAGNWAVGTPGVTYSLRGLLGFDVTLGALDGPLHSGMAGGIVPDPATALARLIDSMVDEHGDVAVDGFWDDVRALSPGEAGRIAALSPSPDAMAHTLGLRRGVELSGDPSVPLLERLWMRPTLTVIGIDSHPIEGSSNQIVAAATARISMRLAPGQDPHRCWECVQRHITGNVPWGLEVDLDLHESVPAWACEPEGPAFEAAARALRIGFGAEAVLMGVGGTIPFVGPFAAAFGGIPAILLGPADPGSRIHGEDESLHLGDWASLIASEIHLLGELA